MNCGKATSVGTVYLQPISIERNQSVRRSAARTHAFYTQMTACHEMRASFFVVVAIWAASVVSQRRVLGSTLLNPQLTLNFSAPGLYIMYTHDIRHSQPLKCQTAPPRTDGALQWPCLASANSFCTRAINTGSPTSLVTCILIKFARGDVAHSK